MALYLKLRNEVVDVTYPDGRALVLRGPTSGLSRTITASTPDGSASRVYPQPPSRGRLLIELAGAKLLLTNQGTRSPCNCHLRFDVPADVKVERRAWRGRQAP